METPKKIVNVLRTNINLNLKSQKNLKEKENYKLILKKKTNNEVWNLMEVDINSNGVLTVLIKV